MLGVLISRPPMNPQSSRPRSSARMKTTLGFASSARATDPNARRAVAERMHCLISHSQGRVGFSTARGSRVSRGSGIPLIPLPTRTDPLVTKVDPLARHSDTLEWGRVPEALRGSFLLLLGSRVGQRALGLQPLVAL